MATTLHSISPRVMALMSPSAREKPAFLFDSSRPVSASTSTSTPTAGGQRPNLPQLHINSTPDSISKPHVDRQHSITSSGGHTASHRFLDEQQDSGVGSSITTPALAEHMHDYATPSNTSFHIPRLKLHASSDISAPLSLAIPTSQPSSASNRALTGSFKLANLSLTNEEEAGQQGLRPTLRIQTSNSRPSSGSSVSVSSVSGPLSSKRPHLICPTLDLDTIQQQSPTPSEENGTLTTHRNSNQLSTPAPQCETRHQRASKLAYFGKDCTPLTPYLYVGSKQVAENKELLSSVGITHIINCIGDICENQFPESFTYMKLHLLDSSAEDIICILYPVLEFVQTARAAGGKVLIHCQQGVSRSCGLCIAHIMKEQNLDYDEAYTLVRSKRGICRPNVGFMCQLLAWRKRMTHTSNRPFCLYRMAPHCTRDRRVVSKWMDRVDGSSMDSRGLYVLTCPEEVIIWVGSECKQEELYMQRAIELIYCLQQSEYASDDIAVIHQRDEQAVLRHMPSLFAGAGIGQPASPESAVSSPAHTPRQPAIELVQGGNDSMAAEALPVVTTLFALPSDLASLPSHSLATHSTCASNPSPYESLQEPLTWADPHNSYQEFARLSQFFWQVVGGSHMELYHQPSFDSDYDLQKPPSSVHFATPYNHKQNPPRSRRNSAIGISPLLAQRLIAQNVEPNDTNAVIATLSTSTSKRDTLLPALSSPTNLPQSVSMPEMNTQLPSAASPKAEEITLTLPPTLSTMSSVSSPPQPVHCMSPTQIDSTAERRSLYRGRRSSAETCSSQDSCASPRNSYPVAHFQSCNPLLHSPASIKRKQHQRTQSMDREGENGYVEEEERHADGAESQSSTPAIEQRSVTSRASLPLHSSLPNSPFIRRFPSSSSTARSSVASSRRSSMHANLPSVPVAAEDAANNMLRSKLQRISLNPGESPAQNDVAVGSPTLNYRRVSGRQLQLTLTTASSRRTTSLINHNHTPSSNYGVAMHPVASPASFATDIGSPHGLLSWLYSVGPNSQFTRIECFDRTSLHSDTAYVLLTRSSKNSSDANFFIWIGTEYAVPDNDHRDVDSVGLSMGKQLAIRLRLDDLQIRYWIERPGQESEAFLAPLQQQANAIVA